MSANLASSGTIAGVFPSVPQDDDRDPWGDDVSREIARSSPRAAAGVYGAVPDDESLPASSTPDEAEDDEDEPEIEVVPVRRNLSIAIAGFTALLAGALIVGAQTAGLDARAPYGIVIFGIQLLYVLAWVMAMRPPVPALLIGVSVVAAAVADYRAVTDETPGIVGLLLIALGGAAVAVIGQLILRVDRLRVRDALGSTVLTVFGVVAFAALVTLTRKPVGAQSITMCLAAAGLALVVARLTDAVYPKPRIAPQVPRGATGIILGAMLGTLGAAQLGSLLVFPFTPAKGAILGLVAAGFAVLVDLAVNFTEAGRGLADEAPQFWLARHMQGPLAAFAVAAPVTYICAAFLS
jgi:hypothetical protein